MRSSDNNTIKFAVLTVSDSCSRGSRKDESGEHIKALLKGPTYMLSQHDIVPDSLTKIRERLTHYADTLKVDLVLTTGGTGISPTDLTPEATSSVIEKEIPGIPEVMRTSTFQKTRTSLLSRSKAGVRKRTIIINLPGSKKAVDETLGSILDIIPHAVQMLNGQGHNF